MQLDFKTEHIERDNSIYEPFDWGIDFTKQEFKEFEERHLENNKIVEKILYGWEISRNSDFLLFIEFLRFKYGIRLTNSKEDVIIHLPRKLVREELFFECPDASGRIRRKFNQKDKYLPNRKDVIIRRSKSEKFLRKILK